MSGDDLVVEVRDAQILLQAMGVLTVIPHEWPVPARAQGNLVRYVLPYADGDELEALSLAFPGLVAAFRVSRRVNGMARLRALAGAP